MGNKLVTEADRKRTPRVTNTEGVKLRSGGGQKISLERGTATRIASADAFRLAGIGPGDIDVAQLQKDMEDPKLDDILKRNADLAKALDVRGTPAFVIGNQFVPGAVDAATFKQLIGEARKG